MRTAVALGCAVAATATSPAAAQTATAPAPLPHTLTVTGTAQVKPEPRDRKSNESIKKAISNARRAAIPLAIGNGQGRALTLSKLAGLTLGELIAIAESPGTLPFLFSPFGEEGTFGPGRYCGTVRRRIVRTDSQGRRRVVGTRSSRQCRIPPFVHSSLTLVYSTT